MTLQQTSDGLFDAFKARVAKMRSFVSEMNIV